MASRIPKTNLANWDPPAGGGRNDEVTNRLMSTDASDNADAINGTNKRDRWQGKAGKPKGKTGIQGWDF